MQLLTWVFVVVGVLEVMNVAVLYRAPGSRKANGVGVFTAWEKSKADPEVHLLVRYLVYWVAGVKVIFLALLAVIVVTATERTKTAAAPAICNLRDVQAAPDPPEFCERSKALLGYPACIPLRR